MRLSALSIFVVLCLGLTVGQVQLRVYRGTLVHSRVLERIEILQDHLLGFDANNLGEVSARSTVWQAKYRYLSTLVCTCKRYFYSVNYFDCRNTWSFSNDKEDGFTLARQGLKYLFFNMTRASLVPRLLFA